MPSARRPTGARPEALFQPPPERQPLAARMRPRNLDEFVGQEHLVGERGPLRRGDRPRPPLARSCSGDRRGPARPASPASSRPRSVPTSRRCRRSCRASSRSAPTIAEAQERLDLHGTRTHPLPRRDPSLQQGPAGRAPAPRRGRHGHADRRDDREPLLRGQLGAPVADARLAARGADRRGGRRPSSGGRSTDEERGLAGALGPDGGVALDRRRVRAPRLAGRRRRAGGAQRPRGRDGARRVARTSGTPRAASVRASRTSRPPRSSASSPTTAPATATTTRSPRSSRACAATTPTPPSTGWRR